LIISEIIVNVKVMFENVSLALFYASLASDQISFNQMFCFRKWSHNDVTTLWHGS